MNDTERTSTTGSDPRNTLPPIELNPWHYQPPLPVPDGHTKQGILKALCSISIDGSHTGELTGYATADCERFLRTLDMVPHESGKSLEIGANPYFTTLLLRKFRPEYDHVISNYFNGDPGVYSQKLTFDGFDGVPESFDLQYHSLNVEQWEFPFADDELSVVLFCEVLEHMTMDPLHVIREISRVLETGGKLVLTTPNVARLENVIALLEGRNLYDPYSAYGPYGRHNREYTRDELHRLLIFCGFEAEISYTANVHSDIPPDTIDTEAVARTLTSVKNREYDMGQYLFTRWRKVHACPASRPRWLYRSYPETEMAR